MKYGIVQRMVLQGPNRPRNLAQFENRALELCTARLSTS